jgi:hypothetical protein
MLARFQQLLYRVEFVSVRFHVHLTQGSPLDVHVADCICGIQRWKFAALLKKVNTSCCEQLIKTLTVNLPIAIFLWLIE